jgi:hypothetical protein
LPHRSLHNLTAGEIAMKRCNMIFVPLGVLIALAAHADVTAKTPRIAAAQNAAGVISHAQRAITSFVAACASRDAARLNSVTTDDVRIEYALEDPGSYLSVDAASLITACAAQADASSTGPRIANLWIFPTSDASTVFVQYDLTAGAEGPPQRRQLALVELRGERIARMLNYSGAPQALVAGAARAVASTTTAARGAE